ncbi:amidase [Vagococcus hydrophili]|uniref:Amidase n=1 Tax=Vagococcus hydrophili TaxID=2714947 RepID=A0A6G8AWR0_9ENTE|nr:amidase [Vagococcus hydrophili]QIL49494.1 amidase [Vagococcus hydrophili]
MVKDATYLAGLIRNNDMSPMEALDEMYKKAKANEKLNAFVELDLDKAKKSLESDKQNLKNSPFYGVPFPLKDLGQSKEGFSQTMGSKLFKNNIANQTNNYVSRIEQAGFVPFGVTTAPEFGFKNVTDADINGDTLNPLDITRYSGGSSGGAASVVASGISPIAGASDGGGSIRIPASFTGLIGMKPSRGKIVTGPDGFRDWQGASVNFVLGVSIRDTKKMLRILKPNKQFSPFNQPKASLPVVNRPLKIAVCTTSPIGNPVSDEAIQAVHNAAIFLEGLGHSVEMIDYPVDGLGLIKSYYQMNGGETANMMNHMEKAFHRPLLKEDMELMTWAIYQFGKKLSAADYADSFNIWDQSAVIMEQLFETYDIFLSPTATTIAPKITDDLQSDEIRERMHEAEFQTKEELDTLIYDMFEKSLWITPYTQLANLTGQPAISLPTHMTEKENLPIGVQLMASKGNDSLLLEVGKWFEELHKLMIPKVYE